MENKWATNMNLQGHIWDVYKLHTAHCWGLFESVMVCSDLIITSKWDRPLAREEPELII